ncbi:MAG: MBL fold metallo-hydrolase [Candidatus Sumerlaeota bacterium]|nr:MBL fold metallo-hydrolase [Candidatus Sumerlaeota bacterium]
MTTDATRTLELYFINVELGNAVLAVTPSGQSILLDAAAPEPINLERILAAMNDAGVTKIDYLVISHYDWDHYGTVPELAEKVPILNYVDHGPWETRGAESNKTPGPIRSNPQYTAYLKARAKGNHIAAQPGDRIPFDGGAMTVVSSDEKVLSAPMERGGGLNHAMWMTQLALDNYEDDRNSVGVVLEFGQFRFIDLGDLTWNVSCRLFSPENKIGPVDLYLITHHALSRSEGSLGAMHQSAAACPPCEVYGLRPRVGILSCAEDYVTRLRTPEVFQRLLLSPGLEDIWQTNMQVQGGPANNAPERFIASVNSLYPQGGDWIKTSAEEDGSFTVTNKRNGFSKRYPAGKPSVVIRGPDRPYQPPSTPAAPPPANSTEGSPAVPRFTFTHTLAEHESYVSSVAFSPDSRLLATACWDGTARLWDVASGKKAQSLVHHQMALTSVAFSPDGRWLAVGSDDTTVTLWEAATGRLAHTLDDHASYVLSVAFSPDGRRLATSTAHGKIKIWDVSNGQEVLTFPIQPQALTRIAFSPDGRLLASGMWERVILFWEPAGGRLLRTIEVPEGHYNVDVVAFRPDGRVLVSSSRGGDVRLWDVATGECVRSLFAKDGRPHVCPIAFEPDGRWMATGCGLGIVQFWDAATGKELGHLTAHARGVESVAVSPDGRWLATGSDDNTARLWRADE